MFILISIIISVLNYNFMESIFAYNSFSLLDLLYKPILLEMVLFDSFSRSILLKMMLCIIVSTLISVVKYKKNTKIINSKKIFTISLLRNIIILILVLLFNIVIMTIIAYTLDTYTIQNSFILNLLHIAFSLLSLVALIWIVLVSPFYIIFKSRYGVEKFINKENRKIINKIEEERKEKERLEEEHRKEIKKLQEEKERLEAEHRNKIIQLQEEKARTIRRKYEVLLQDTVKSLITIDEVLTSQCEFKKEISYNYTNELIVTTNKSKEIWANNDEKINYYNKSFSSLDSRLDSDYEVYIKNLLDRLSNMTRSLNIISREFYSIEKLQHLNKRKINSLSKYFQSRINDMKMDFRGCKVGIDGEKRVNEELDLYTNIINLQNIRLEVKDNNGNIHSIENDNILLTSNGIFVLEVKNFGEIGNYDIIIEKDGRWLRKNRYNGEISTLHNVTKQNNRHIGFLNKFINESINRDFDNYINAEGIVVIANEKVTIENHNNNQNVFRDSELYAYIQSKPIKFKKEELDKIRNVIINNNLPPKKYPVYDYCEEIYNNVKSLENYVYKYENIVNKLNIQYEQYLDEIKLI